MKKDRKDMAKPVPRGLRALVLLGVSSALALGGLIATASAGRETPTRSAAVHDPMTEAKVAFVDGDLVAAERILRSVPDTTAKTLLGRVLLERGRYEEASRLLGEVLKDDPKNFEANRAMAMASRRIGRVDLAVLYWTRATELRKDDAQVWRELALCQREQDDRTGAMTSIQQSLALDPNQADLSSLLTEVAIGRRSLATQTVSPPWMPTDSLIPRAPDPSSLIAQPRLPDPLQNFPKSQGSLLR